ncbi:tumor necrosis factor ligand superfamily member 13B-like [Aplochiton taeniatus]
MLHKVLLLVTILVLCLSLILVYKVRVLEKDFKKLREEIFIELKQSYFEDSGDGVKASISKVLFESPGFIMGHIVRNSHTVTSQAPTELLRCLQGTPQSNFSNSCYTAGILQLEQEDELELVILDRPNPQISMDTDSTFFGIMLLN